MNQKTINSPVVQRSLRDAKSTLLRMKPADRVKFFAELRESYCLKCGFEDGYSCTCEEEDEEAKRQAYREAYSYRPYKPSYKLDSLPLPSSKNPHPFSWFDEWKDAK